MTKKNEITPKQRMTLIKKRLQTYDTTVHGLRSTFRTWAGEATNYNPGIIEFALAHQLDEKTEGAYFRSQLFERRIPLMQDWADYLMDNGSQANLIHH